MVDEAAAMDGPPIMKGLVEGIEHKARMGGPARSPTNDAAGEGVNHKGHVDEPLPSRDIREVRKPEHVWRGSLEVAVYAVERTRGSLVRYGGFDGLAANDALKTHYPHEPC